MNHQVTVHNPVRLRARRLRDMRFDIECTCGWSTSATWAEDAYARARIHANESGGEVLTPQKPKSA